MRIHFKNVSKTYFGSLKLSHVILKLLHCKSIAEFFISIYQSMKFVNLYSGDY